MKAMTIPMAMVLASVALPAAAQGYDQGNGGYQQQQYDNRGDRQDDHDQGGYDGNGHHRDSRHDDHHDRDQTRADYRQDGDHWRDGRHYDWNRPDPRANGYYADRYYRAGNYQPRYLSANERVYRGSDNRYYCRRSDGTTGLVIGAVGGGVLGNAIAPGGSKTVGTLFGGVLGAIVGQSVDHGSQRVQCR